MAEHPEIFGVHRIPTPNPFPVEAVNVFLHQGDAITLFDAGTFLPNAYGILECRLGELGMNIRDIDRIILTHHHLDHIGLSRRIRDASGAPVCAHPRIVEQIALMRETEKMREHLQRLLPELGAPAVVVERTIAAREHFSELMDDFVVDETLPDNAVTGPFRVCFRPGHSATDTVFVHEQQGWAVTGDHLIEKITPNPILRYCAPGDTREKSLVQYCESLRKTRELDIDWCFSGHGAPFQNHRAVVDGTFDNIHRRSRRILQTVPTAGATPFEVMGQLFPKMAPKTFYYCLSAAASHLELLECEGQVRSEYRSGILYYLPTA